MSEPSEKEPKRDICVLPEKNVTTKDGYVLEKGSGVYVEIIRKDPGRDHAELPAVRLWLQFPSSRKIVLIDRMFLPIESTDTDIWEWYMLAEAAGNTAEEIAKQTTILVTDGERSGSIAFTCHLNLTPHSHSKQWRAREVVMPLPGIHVPGFFVPHSGKSAIAPPNIHHVPGCKCGLTDCNDCNSTEVSSLHMPA